MEACDGREAFEILRLERLFVDEDLVEIELWRVILAYR